MSERKNVQLSPSSAPICRRVQPWAYRSAARLTSTATRNESQRDPLSTSSGWFAAGRSRTPPSGSACTSTTTITYSSGGNTRGSCTLLVKCFIGRFDDAVQHGCRRPRSSAVLKFPNGGTAMNCESPHPDASRDGPAGSTPVSSPSFIHRVLDAIPPASGAIVMASSIVWINLHSDDHRILSASRPGSPWPSGWCWPSCWACARCTSAIASSTRPDHPPRSTGVAGTAVLGTRLAIEDYDTAAVADRVTAWSASAAEHCCDSSAALASSKAHCGQRREIPPFWSLNSTG